MIFRSNGLGYFLLSQFLIAFGGFQLLLLCLRIRIRFMVEGDEDWKVIRAEMGKALELDRPEMVRMKEVIERESQERQLCVEAVVETAADARIKQAADVQEQVVRPVPGTSLPAPAAPVWNTAAFRRCFLAAGARRRPGQSRRRR